MQTQLLIKNERTKKKIQKKNKYKNTNTLQATEFKGMDCYNISYKKILRKYLPIGRTSSSFLVKPIVIGPHFPDVCEYKFEFN